MHVYGQMIMAQLENKATSPTPVSRGLVYWDTALLRSFLHNGSAWERILSTATGAVTFDSTATPGTPPAVNTFFLYFKSDGNAYRMNPAGVEQLVGGNASGGQLTVNTSVMDTTVSAGTTLTHPQLVMNHNYTVDSGGTLLTPESLTITSGKTLTVQPGGLWRVM